MADLMEKNSHSKVTIVLVCHKKGTKSIQEETVKDGLCTDSMSI